MLSSGIGSFIVFALVLGGLIFVHEMGHFLAAKRLGIHVEEFGFGFPPRLVGLVREASGKWRVVIGPKPYRPADGSRPNTIYSLNAIPLGGFVRPTGEDDPTAPGGLASASKRVRIAVLAAGSTFNLIFAFLVFVVSFRVGWPDGRVIIADVSTGSPAAAAGLMPGDAVLQANDTLIVNTSDLSAITYSHLGEPITFVFMRGDTRLETTLTPRTEWPEGQGPMGITMDRELVQYGWGQAVVRAGQEMVYQFRVLIELPARLISGEVPLAVARPIGIVGLNDLTREAVGRAQEVNQLYPVLQLIGLVSVALATTNLLPIPALDGGRILFVLIEAIRGRRLDPAREGMVHVVGMLVLLALMVVITYQDIFNPIFPR